MGFADKVWILRHKLFPGSLASKQIPDDAAIVLFTSGLLREIPLLGTGKTDYVRLKKLAEESTVAAA